MCIVKSKRDVNHSLTDYKIHCFNGKPQFILACKNRYSIGGVEEDFYDIKWRRLDFGRPGVPRGNVLDMPVNLNRMLYLLEALSDGIDFLRVDFYEVNGKLYFGELTLYPASGVKLFSPPQTDYVIGGMLHLRN